MYILHVFTLVCKTPCIRTSQLQALYKTKYHSAYLAGYPAVCVVCLAPCSVVQQVGFVHIHLMANGENCTMHTYSNTYILHTLLAILQDMHTLQVALRSWGDTNGVVRTLLGVDW